MAVLVVGAGPTGLTLACGLRAAGVPTRVLDRAGGPARTSRALGLQPRGAEVLDRLGALGDLTRVGLPVRQVVVTVDGRELARLRVGRTTPLVNRPGLMMSQAVVEDRLRARLLRLGVDVEWAREVVGLDPAGDGVAVTFADGRTERFTHVAGCDGAHSAVRRHAGIDFPGVPLIERFLLADVRADWPLPRDAVATWLNGAQLLAAFPLPGDDLWRLLAPQPADLPDDLDPAGRVAVLLDLLTRHAGLHRESVRAVDWTSAFRIHRRLADTYRRGPVLLAGDAAHIHSPFGGQGMNTGIGDAENLAWKLALVEHGRAGAALLDTYEAERRPVARDVLTSTSSLTRLVLGGTPAARLLRDHLLVPLFNTDWLQRRITDASSQLRVSYRGGPLGGWHPVRRPRPGDRVPDLPCRRPDGTATRLYAELSGRFAVLGPDPGAATALADQLAVHLGPVVALVAAGAVRVVRPDGHLACRGNARTVRHWLRAASILPGAALPGAVAPARPLIAGAAPA